MIRSLERYDKLSDEEKEQRSLCCDPFWNLFYHMKGEDLELVRQGKQKPVDSKNVIMIDGNIYVREGEKDGRAGCEEG